MVHTVTVGSSVAAYSHGAIVGDLVFTSGLTSHDPESGEVRGTTIAAQTRLSLELLDAILQKAGSSLADLVQVQVFLDDIDADFASFDETYRSLVPAPYPPRATVGARLPGYLIEMTAVAAVARH